MREIGFMQGRLSPIENGRIQSFPWHHWENEIQEAISENFTMMEWTLDQDRLYSNPLMTEAGQNRIFEFKQKFNFKIPSLTGDCFMQAPFYKANTSQANDLKQDFMQIFKSCHRLGIEFIVMPLVDNGKMENRDQEDNLVNFLLSIQAELKVNGQKVIFECDYSPTEYKRFIDRLPAPLFGVNYDIGNSASLDIPAADEFSLYGNRILNVHIKDRVKGGTTVPLSEGHADFKSVFKELQKINYQGNFILQTARAKDEQHMLVLKKYRAFAEGLIAEYLT
jgi:L-ribulose-5-phosphate 3-epimerase